MNIHEYQAKALLARYKVPVAQGSVAFTAAEAESAAQQLGGPVWVVKTQINESGIDVIAAADLADAAEKVVNAVKEAAL